MTGRVILVAALLLTACTAGSSDPARPPEPVDAARLYQRQCAVCHGATGQGDGPSASLNRAPSIASAEFHANNTDEDIALVIREGRGLMPPWSHLGDERIAALVAFVRTLEQSE